MGIKFESLRTVDGGDIGGTQFEGLLCFLSSELSLGYFLSCSLK